jgi:predicted nucleic-acid-binding Zn-ribbon protein
LKDGICPKCKSHEVYCGAEIVLKSGPFGSNSIPISLASIAALDNFVCTNCGYVESYVSDSKKLKEICQKWHKAKPPEPSAEKKA